MRRRITPALALAIAAGIALAGCTPDPEPAPSSTPLPSASIGDGDLEDLVEVPDAEPLETAAVDALTAYLDKDANPWFDGLRPHLTDAAAAAYGTVQPANIPPAEIDGDPYARLGTNPELQQVDVPTTIGIYTVNLERENGAGPWLAASFVPPAQ